MIKALLLIITDPERAQVHTHLFSQERTSSKVAAVKTAASIAEPRKPNGHNTDIKLTKQAHLQVHLVCVSKCTIDLRTRSKMSWGREIGNVDVCRSITEMMKITWCDLKKKHTNLQDRN